MYRFQCRQRIAKHLAFLVGKGGIVQATHTGRTIRSGQGGGGFHCCKIAGQAALIGVAISFDHLDAVRDCQRIVVVVHRCIDDTIEPVVNKFLLSLVSIGSATDPPKLCKYVQ